MAMLEMLEEYVEEKVVKDGWTYSKLSAHLKEQYPGVRGFSVRSIERFCGAKNIHKTSRLRAEEVDIAVAGAIVKVTVSSVNSS